MGGAATPFYFFEWNDSNIDSIAQHGVTQDEFEEVVGTPHRIDNASDKPEINCLCVRKAGDLIDRPRHDGGAKSLRPK